MNKRDGRNAKLAIVMLALFGAASMGLPSCAVNVYNQSGFTNTDNYNGGQSDPVNITSNINLSNANLPNFTGTIDAYVNGNNHTISGSIFNSDSTHDNTLTYGHYTLQDSSSLTLSNIAFQTNTTIQGSGNNSRTWQVYGIIAQNADVASTLNISSSVLSNNYVMLTQDRNYGNDAYNHIYGGILNNRGLLNVDGAEFNSNSINILTNQSATIMSGDSHSELYGGIIANYETGNATISNAQFNNNTVSVTSNASNGRSDVRVLAKGGVINNLGNVTLNNVEINNNSLTAKSDNNGDALETKGGAISNGGTLNMEGNVSITGNSLSAAGANSNSAQGGAIYNDGVININNGKTLLSGNTSQGAANDIYFASNSSLNVNNGAEIEIASGIESADNTASVFVNSGGNYINANAGSSNYTGLINVKTGGLLTYKADTIDGGILNSLNNANVVMDTNSGYGFDISNDFTLGANHLNSIALTSDGTLNIRKFNLNNMTLDENVNFGSYADEFIVEEGVLTGRKNNFNTQNSVITVQKDGTFVYRTTTDNETFENNVVLNDGATLNIEGKDNTVISSSPQFNGSSNNVNLNNGSFVLNTDFDDGNAGLSQNININNSSVSFGASTSGIAETTNLNGSTLNLADNKISTVEFAELNALNSQLNVDIDLNNNISDIVKINLGSGTINLDSINFIGAATETNYAFQILQGGYNFGAYNDTLSSAVYDYLVTTNGTNILLNATGISANGLKYYNNTLTGDRTFDFIGNSTYYIASDLESTNGGNFVVNGKDNNAQNSVISGSDKYSFFEVNSDKLTLNNLTVQNAYATDDSSANNSSNINGSVLNMAGGSAEFNNVVLNSNKADGMGGAVYVSDGTLQASDVTLNSNSAVNGGAIALQGGEITLNNAGIQSNVASNEGSAIYNDGGTVNLNDVQITNNSGNSSIYNSGNININNTATNTIDNGQNAVIKNSGTITFDGSGNTSVNDLITGIGSNKGNIVQNSSDLNLDNVNNQNIIQNNGNLTVNALSGSTLNSNGTNLNIESAQSSEISANNDLTEIKNAISSVINTGSASANIGNLTENSTANATSGLLTVSNSSNSTVNVSNSAAAQITDFESSTYNQTSSAASTITNAINSNITIESGNLTIAALTTDIDSDSSLNVSGGEVTVNNAISGNIQNNVSNVEINVSGGTLNSADISNSDITVNGILNVSGDILNGELNNRGEVNLNKADTTLSASVAGNGNINKTGGNLELTNTSNDNFEGNLNVAQGNLTFNQDAMLNSAANINLDNSVFNFALTNAENISLTSQDFSSVNLKNASTMNVDGTGINQDISIQVGNGFWTSDNSGNTLNFSNASYYLLNEAGGTQQNKDILSFTDANLGLQTNQTWANTIKLSNSLLDLSNQSAGDTYTFNNLDASSNDNQLSLDVSLVYDKDTGITPYADKITAESGSGILELTKLFITDDNGGAVNYKDSIQVITNNNGANLQLAASDDVEILSWATNVYEYGIETATTNTTADSIKITPEGVSSTDTLRDLNHYNGNRGFSFVVLDGSGNTVKNKYNIYRDLDTTAEGNFSIIGRIENGQKSILSGELKELHIGDDDTRYDSINNRYDYYGPEGDSGRPVVDSANVNPDMVTNENGEYVFEVGALDNDNPVKTNGSLFELTNETNLYITDVQIQDTLRTYTDNIKDGAAIYANNNSATVELENVDFKNNTVQQGSGGAIANVQSSSFILKDSVVENNTSSQNGGAIYNTSSGQTLIQNAQFNNNTANGQGGAIYTSGDLTIINSNFSNNNMQNNVANDIYIADGKTTFEVNEGVSSTISSGIAGANNAVFEKTDLGVLNLTGNNKSFSGQFNLADNGGTVLYSANNENDSFVSGSVSVGQNAELLMNVSSAANAQTINNLSGEGIVAKQGDGNMNLSGKNTNFNGTFNIEEGNVNYFANNYSSYFGEDSSTNVSQNANLNITFGNSITSSQVLYNVSGEGNINKDGAGKLLLTGNNEDFTGKISLLGGSIEYQNIQGSSPSGTNYISGLTELSDGTTLISNIEGVTDTITGTITGTGSFIKNGSGELVYTGDMSGLTGETEIESGVFEFVKSQNGGYAEGLTTISNNGEFIYNTNGNDALLAQDIEGSGAFTKDGSGTLTLQGNYGNFSGVGTIKEGVLNYIANSGNNYFGGSTLIDKNGELIYNTNGIDSKLSNVSDGISGGGIFNKTGDGTLTLTGNNSNFTGNTILNKGTLAFSDSDGSSYFAGATTIGENAILAYTTGSSQTLNNVLGQGVIEKYGNGNLTFDYVSNNQKFEGVADVNQGTLTVNAATNANNNFDFNINVNNNANLVYNGAEGQNYNIGQNSKVQFGNGANGANIEFNSGNYNLQGDLNNSSGNTTTFNNSTITLAANNYAGGYNINGSQIDLSDGSFSEHTFESLKVNNTELALDINFENPENSDKLIAVNEGGQVIINELNILPETGAQDSGENPVQFNVLGGLLVIDKNGSIKSNGYSTDLYEYSVSYGDDGQSIILTKTGISDSNSLKKQNINTDTRNFEFTAGAANPYEIDEDLTQTGKGTFTVSGLDTNDKPITTISGKDENSMFEVTEGVSLAVKDINFTNANATDNDVNIANPDYSKTSANKNGSVLSNKGGSVQFDNVVAKNNKSEGFGGALYIESGETILNNVEMEGNVHYQNGTIASENDIYVKNGAELFMTGTNSIKSGLAGDGNIVQTGDLTLSGNNKNYTGTLNVGGNLEFIQEDINDSYIAGTSVIYEGADVLINNDFSDVEGNFKGNGNLTLLGDKNFILKGNNSEFIGEVTLDGGRIVLNSDNAKYFGGKTILNDNTGIDVKGSNNSLLTSVSGGENTSINKDGSGTLVMGGDNSQYTGDLFVNEGAFALQAGSSLGKLSNAAFADGTSLNLVNTTSVQRPDGSWTTNPNPSSLEDFQVGNLELDGDVNLYIDADLANAKADMISADNVSGNGFLILGKNGINAVSDALVDEVSVQIANSVVANYIKLASSDIEVMGPIQLYAVDYDNGLLNFSALGGNTPSYNQVNPSIMAGAVAAQMGGYLVQLNSYDEAFRNMDMYMLMTKKQREALKYKNKYAYQGSDIIYDPTISRYENKSGWLRPYATFEQVDLRSGADVSNVAYGSFFGVDSELVDLGHGWDGVWSLYAGYNGSHQSYDGIGIYQNGGTLGAVGMAYKGNFFTGLTANVGASSGRASVDMGYDDFSMLMSGVASKTGYNFELADGKFIIQPNYLMSYSFINTFDYTSASGVRITSDPLHAIHIEPGIKFIGNLRNGWQPYGSVSMIWNIMDNTRFRANDVYLPELSIKPFVKYGVGLRKSWGERFTGYFQAYVTNGGRNGIGLQAGFNWALGKQPVLETKKATGKTPKVESVKFTKK